MKIASPLTLISFIPLLVGCGQGLTGTYTGTETVTINGVQQSNLSITISLTQVNNDITGGAWQSTNGVGTFTSRPSGEFSLPYNLISLYTGTAYSSTLSASAALNCGVYVGKLTMTPNQISGRLELTQPAALPVGATTGVTPSKIQDVCPSVRVINAAK